MQALVTGASGFVGSWLVKALVAHGYKVSVISRKSSEAKTKEFEVITGDVTNLESLLRAFSGMDIVFHLAGHVGYSKAERELMEQINVQGTSNVLAACIRNGVKRLVHMSSVVAVGASFDGLIPLNEQSHYNLTRLNLGYFETKRKAETLALSAAATGKLEVVCVNPSTIYGAGDAAKGSRKVQLKVAHGQFPFYTGGGVSVVAVEDVVAATISAAKIGKSGERYILSGENISIQQLFNSIAQLAGSKAPHIFLPNWLVRTIGKYGDVMEGLGKRGPLNTENAWSSILFHWFDHTKAKSELNFSPKPALYALENSVRWIKDNRI